MGSLRPSKTALLVLTLSLLPASPGAARAAGFGSAPAASIAELRLQLLEGRKRKEQIQQSEKDNCDGIRFAMLRLFKALVAAPKYAEWQSSGSRPTASFSFKFAPDANSPNGSRKSRVFSGELGFVATEGQAEFKVLHLTSPDGSTHTPGSIWDVANELSREECESHDKPIPTSLSWEEHGYMTQPAEGAVALADRAELTSALAAVANSMKGLDTANERNVTARVAQHLGPSDRAIQVGVDESSTVGGTQSSGSLQKGVGVQGL